jgi:SpoVK/Ycf46/Vps4 family AAA+-type ATPase
LIQIKAAALLSKYYSESAKQVDMIFTTLQQRCEDDPEEFICVLIDEVETIAISREASANGESQESLRATNAFLTGLDRTKGFANIVFLCTSNMVGSLDAAFLDRCGLRHEVEPPSIASQYSILRGRIHRLVSRGIILSDKELPLYRDAQEDKIFDSELPGGKLLHIIELLDSAKHNDEEEAISGRSLTQLPEQALLRYLRGEDCDLDLALEFIKRYVLEEQDRVKTEEREIKEEEESAMSVIEDGPGKRKAGAMLDEDESICRGLGVLGDLIAGELQKRRKVL